MSKSNVDSLVVSILAYVVENKSSNTSIQAQVVGLLGAELPLIVRELSHGKTLDAIQGEFATVQPEIIQVLNGLVDKAPSLASRNNAVSDLVKRVNRAFSGEATKQASALAQTTKSGTLTYPVMGRSIKDKVATVTWSAHTLDFAQQIGKDGKIKPEAKITKGVAGEGKGKAEVKAAHEPANMAELVAVAYQYCAKLNIKALFFRVCRRDTPDR